LVNLKVEKNENLVFFCWPPMSLKTKPQPWELLRMGLH
jgi:hypothetical protein